jgi:GrpB-like predicted nucleotidyltransferase (UPF0157 family)
VPGQTKMAKRIVIVVDYDEEWPRRFEELRARIWPAVSDIASRIEHVGSTSVPGLAAKPIIDMTIVVGGRSDVPLAIEHLATLGYRHRGNLGIEDRESFDHRTDLPPHNQNLPFQAPPAQRLSARAGYEMPLSPVMCGAPVDSRAWT